jgi:hypothetical protein
LFGGLSAEWTYQQLFAAVFLACSGLRKVSILLFDEVVLVAMT